ncbi:MAG: 16S rRNA (guanine(966)-N(2))-methyltransferase RsmD [Bdellovibrionales bacterium]|nr:16S rRNA (guanine(966)-N(2))-methyltransferase RsmD [Bdellovibrionales bacterium]
MRVISGKYRGHHLVDFKADNIRPTTDRVKETLFNKLMGRVEDARVLDLFSGTGNLAIECMSRGAAWVDLVENHRKSLGIIKENLSKLKINEGFKVFPIDAFKYIKEYSGEPYDLVIADPPFTQALADDLGKAIASSRLLGADTWVVIEASAQETVLENYGTLVRFDQRTFGDKHLNFFAPA